MTGIAAAFALALALQEPSTEGRPYPIVGTGRTVCYDEARRAAAAGLRAERPEHAVWGIVDRPPTS